MHDLIRQVWRDCGMTIVMVTHDIREAFLLGTRLITLDHPRIDPQAPGRYGATITYDLELKHKTPAARVAAAVAHLTIEAEETVP